MAASAICKDMGYESYDSTTIDWGNNHLWSGLQASYPIALDDVACDSENFAECTYDIIDNCEHSEDVYLVCRPGECSWMVGDGVGEM